MVSGTNKSLLPQDSDLGQALVPAARRLSAALLLSIVAMWFFVVIAHDVMHGTTIGIDRRILAYCGAIHSPIFHATMLGISIMAGPIFQSVFWLFWVAWFIIKKRFWPDGFSMLVAGAGGLLIIVGLKYLFRRPRPQVIYDHLGYSFPSGHSFFALVVYSMAGYWITRDLHSKHQRLIWAAISIVIFLVGFSRVALGEHFPSDVVAGFAIGLPWLWACLALPTTFHKNGRDLSAHEVAQSPQSIL
jgi:membrane-associated phospholipid phosphatase